MQLRGKLFGKIIKSLLFNNSNVLSMNENKLPLIHPIIFFLTPFRRALKQHLTPAKLGPSSLFGLQNADTSNTNDYQY